MQPTINSLYFRGEHLTKSQVKKQSEEFADDEVVLAMYNILARYMIAHGVVPEELNSKHLYPYFAELLGGTEEKGKSKWLMQIARRIERNEHKQFNLQDLF